MSAGSEREMTAASVTYAARGWPVFPVRPSDKRPATAHGLHDATTDLGTAASLCRLNPDANLAIRTGAESGLVVLDVDGEPGADSLHELERSYGELPQTIEALTGGGGRHLYFRHPGRAVRNSAGRLGPGLDFRGDGGYVVAPPSVHESGQRYEWEASSHPDEHTPAELPGWLAALLEDRTSRRNGTAPAGELIAEGTRNATLASLGGTMRRRGMTEAEILASLRVTNDQRCSPPLDGEEVERITASVARYEPGQAPSVNGTAPANLSSARSVSSAATDWPGPLGDDAYHGLAGQVVRSIEPHSEADPAALLIQLLAAFGNASRRGAGIHVEGSLHGTNLYVVVVGMTAKGRKGTSWGRNRQLMALADPDWARDCIADGLSSGEGLIHAVRDRVTELEEGEETVVDAGALDKRLMVQEGEFASVLRRMNREGNTLSPVIRTLWDTSNARTLTKANAERATNAHVSIVGHITRDELRRELTATDAASGFANRFLFCCAQRSKVLPRGGALTDAALQPLAEGLREALRFAGTQGALDMDREADALWASEYPRLSEGRPGLYGAVIGRAEAQVLRLAVVYALLDLSVVVREPHIRAALALWRYCDASARHVFGASLGDPIADKLLPELRGAPDGLSRSDIRRLVGGGVREPAIDAGLRTLAEQGRARDERVSTGGRPEERWHYCPTPEETERSEESPPATTAGAGSKGIPSVSSVPYADADNEGAA